MAEKATPAFMIDGPECADRDDAIRLQQAADGTSVLTVYIADLTEALDADPGLLDHALSRGATIYRRHLAVEPMLPSGIQAEPLTERAAQPVVAVHMPIGADGTVGEASLSRETLTGAVALTHAQTALAVKNPRDRHHKALIALRDLAETLFRARYGSSSAFYDLAKGVYVDEDGALVKVRASHVVGYLIVQECMIAANRAVAAWALTNDVPIIFRNHVAAVSEPPAAVRLADLSAALHSGDSGALSMWMAQAELTGHRARYDAYPRGHHALAAPAYAHATSPWRRWADLFTQRAIVSRLEGRAFPFDAKAVAGLCERLTVVTAEAEAAASAAYRQRAHEIARQILEEDADHTALKPAAFFALVKRAAKEGINSPSFLAEVARRAEADLLELRDLYHLLLLPVGEEWTMAKQACLGQVARHPEQAVSLVAMWTVTRGVAQPSYVHAMAGPPHRPVFTAAGSVAGPDGASIQGAARSAGTKQAAQAQAAISVLALLAGAPDPSRDIAEAPEAEPSVEALAVVSGDAFQVLNHAQNIGLLRDVEWEIGQGAAKGGRLLFSARLTARRGSDETIEGCGRGESKKLAKARAAAELVARLSAEPSHV